MPEANISDHCLNYFLSSQGHPGLFQELVEIQQEADLQDQKPKLVTSPVEVLGPVVHPPSTTETYFRNRSSFV